MGEAPRGEMAVEKMDRFEKMMEQAVSGAMPEPKTERAPSPVDHWTPAVLLERGAYLKKLARHGSGAAGETLKEYTRHAAMLSFRNRDGEAEVHARFADLFCVLAGAATLVTGGTVVKARTVATGETRGDGIEGGMRQELRAGDVAHIPAGVPHQMLVSSEKTFTAFVLKIEETE